MFLTSSENSSQFGHSVLEKEAFVSTMCFHKPVACIMASTDHVIISSTWRYFTAPDETLLGMVTINLNICDSSGSEYENQK
jgi:hypothetical protein